MELIVINSTGPMASTVIGSIVEQYGYLNLPVRKRDLHAYLLKKRTLNDPYFKNRTLKIIENMSRTTTSGGTSVIDRNSATPIKRADSNLIREETEEYINKKYESIQEMYIESNELIRKSIIYKNVKKDYIGLIEYTTDIETYEQQIQELYKAYNENFDKIIFINMHREFWSWLNSLASQKFASGKFHIHNLKMNLESTKDTYLRYEKCVAQLPGWNLNFEELFFPKTFEIFKKIEAVLEKKRDFRPEELSYDLYGKVTEYKKTFTKDDDNRVYLSQSTQKLFNYFDTKEYPVELTKYLFILFYLKDLIRFKFKE